ncbi:MAG: hypothetical protein ABFS86_10355 [Planctomycetota bacterium]
MSLILSPAVLAGSDPSREALDGFKKAMKSKSERDRISALDRIVDLPGKSAGKELRRVASRDRSERVRAAAAAAIARRGDPKDLKFLLNLCRTLKKKPIALAGVLDAIGEYRNPKAAKAVADLGRKWMHKHKYPALAAIRALGRIPAKPSVDSLIGMLEMTFVRRGRGRENTDGVGGYYGGGNVSSDTHAKMSDFRQYIVASLRGLTGEIIGAEVSVWKEWWEENRSGYVFGGGGTDPNRMARLTDARYRYSIARPDEAWRWTKDVEEGFTRTAELKVDTKVVGRVSILTYNTWTRSPASTGAMAKLAKQQLFDGVRELGDKETWSEEVELDSVPALKHELSGTREGGRMTLTQVMIAHRDIMYVIRTTTLPGISITQKKHAEDFLPSFKFLD